MTPKEEQIAIKKMLMTNGIKVYSVNKLKDGDTDYLRYDIHNYREIKIDGWLMRLYEMGGFSIGGNEMHNTYCYYSKL